MPLESQAQRAYLHIHHPAIAARFEAETPKGIKLPPHKNVHVKAHKRKPPKAKKQPKLGAARRIAPKPAKSARAAAIAQMQQQMSMGPGGY